MRLRLEKIRNQREKMLRFLHAWLALSMSNNSARRAIKRQADVSRRNVAKCLWYKSGGKAIIFWPVARGRPGGVAKRK